MNPEAPSPPHEIAFTRSAVVCLLLTASVLLAFWPLFDAGFINYDDTDYVTNNPIVQGGLSWKALKWALTTAHASNWHPLTWLSHLLDVELFGKGPAGPHGVNVGFHVANTVLLFILFQRATGARWRSAFLAALFGLHPLHVESVAWIAERKDVLSTFFGILTLLAYAEYARRVGAGPLARPRPSRFYALALACYALGLMSKPMLVTLPFVMWLLDFWPLRRFEPNQKNRPKLKPGSLFWEKAPFLLFSAAACAVTTWAQKLAIQPLEYLPFGERGANALVAYSRYLLKTLWPMDLVLPYLHPGHWPAIQVVLAAVLVTGGCLATVLGRRKYPFVFTGWFWFLGTLVPVIGLVQVGTQSMADRYTYVPLIGVFLVLVWGGAEFLARWRVPLTAAGIGTVSILSVCGLLTRRQAGYWHDSEQLFKHAAARARDNFVALGNVGGVLFEAGRLDEALEFYQRSHLANPRYPEALNSIGAVLAARGNDEAIEWFQKALALQPAHADALFNLGNAMARQGNPRAAAEYFQASLQVKPDNYQARNNLGNAFVKLGRIDDAIAQYQAALDYQPDAPMIHKNLGEMLAAKGKLDEAATHYRQALRYTNDAATHYSLGLTLAVQSHWQEAIDQYAESLRLSPADAEAHYNLGYALRMEGRLDEAALHLREALHLRPDFPLAHYNLACVLADTGHQAEAVEQLQEALRQKPDYDDAQVKLRSLTPK